MTYSRNKIELKENGYSILTELYSAVEVNNILACINNAEQNDASFLKTKDLFAIRQLIKYIPKLKELIFNKNLTDLIKSISQSEYFLTKAIYFDKPKSSNWFVAYHQDLSISVDHKVALAAYKNWTFKKGLFGVQPPLKILQDTITIRLHLDDTDKNNGALKVIPKSHLKGIIPVASKKWNTEEEQVCKVKKGGAMLMKPLLLHASNRTVNNKRRRVIHLELNKHQLPETLNWLEYSDIKSNTQHLT